MDLAFLKSHEFSALLSYADSSNGVEDPVYTVSTQSDEQKATLFESNVLLEVKDFLLETGRKGLNVQRYKGLGEMNADQLLETTMDPQNRVLLAVTAEDEAVADDMFTMLMGELVEPRKDFIEKHAAEVQNLDV